MLVSSGEETARRSTLRRVAPCRSAKERRAQSCGRSSWATQVELVATAKSFLASEVSCSEPA